MRLFPSVGVISSLLQIRRLPVDVREELLTYFTFDNPAYAQAARFSPWGPPKGIPSVITLAQWEENVLSVPRGVDVSKLSERARYYWQQIRWIDRRHTCVPEVPFPRFRLTLNKEQVAVCNHFEGMLADEKRHCPFGNFVYVVPTSGGKTMLQALLAARTGQRTLVLCLTELIMEAWYTDLYKAFGLGGKDVGIIKQKKWSIGEWFTLASIQTLPRRYERWPELFQHFGAVVVDEVDTVTAPNLHRFVAACPAHYLIGATATDRNSTGTGFYLRSYFGATRKRVNQEQRDTDSSLALKSVKVVDTTFTYSFDPEVAPLNFHDLMDHMITHEERNLLILRNVITDWNNGESVLVATKRVAHVHLLKDMLHKAGVKAFALTGETNSDRFYTEKLLQAVRSRKVTCVVSTMQAIKRGANLNPLSVLHLTIPVKARSDLEQLIGRIRRRADKKTTCAITYYRDRQMPYLFGLYKRCAIPVFRKLKVPGYEDMYMA